jgi:predicted dehydrogenase
MGRRHLAALGRVHGVDVVGGVDVDATDAIGELVALGAEAIVVATPAATHRNLVERCLALGRSVLVEKPLATTVTDADALAAAASSARSDGVIVTVGHVERFAWLAAAGSVAVGAPIATSRVSRRPARVTDVGVLLDLAVHDIDLVRHLTGEEYASSRVEVIAVDAGVEVEARIVGVLDSGAAVTHHVSWRAEHVARRFLVGERELDRAATVDPLAEQARAFADACRGTPSRRLATALDGATAVRIATGCSPVTSRERRALGERAR